MRISTNTIFQTGGARISELQVNLSRTQQQIASGKKILNASDDPIGSARALIITQSDAINEQYATNRKTALNSLGIADGVLNDVGTVLHNAKALVVNAGNGTLSDLDRSYIANELQGNLDQLLGFANATDATGAYLFSGYSDGVAPYTKTQGGAQYNGDQGARLLQVDTSRQLAVNQAGSEIFGSIRTSANQFNILPNSSNTGQLVTTAAINVAASGNLTGNNYEVAFDNTGANFTITNKTTGVVSLASTAYTSPKTVTVDGIDITLTNTSGAPAPGDKFQIQTGNQDIFQTLTDLITALRTPATTAAGKLDLNAALSQANNNIDKSLSNTLLARTNIGAALKEIDSLNASGDSVGIIYKQELSSLQDLDYAKAITELNQGQVVLQAAQQSFVKTSNLSLFAYLN